MRARAPYKRNVAAHAPPLAPSTWRPALVVARWVALRGLRQPALGLLGLLLLAWIPLQAQLSPLADLGLDPAWRLAGAWMVPVGLVGAALALGVLARGEAFRELLPWPARLLGEALALGLGALMLQLPLFLGALGIASSGPGELLLRALAADVHAVCVGLLLLRWRAEGPGWAGRVGLFGGILWVLPAMLPVEGKLANGLRWLADVDPQPANGAAWLARGLVFIGFLLATVLLAARRRS